MQLFILYKFISYLQNDQLTVSVDRALHWNHRGCDFESRSSLNYILGVVFATASVAYTVQLWWSSMS